MTVRLYLKEMDGRIWLYFPSLPSQLFLADDFAEMVAALDG